MPEFNLLHHCLLPATGFAAGTLDAIAASGGLIMLPVLLNPGLSLVPANLWAARPVQIQRCRAGRGSSGRFSQ